MVDCMDAMNWANDIFGNADLGDQRRTQRLVRIASLMADSTERTMSENMGNEADNKAAHRFFSNGSFEYEDILQPVIEATIDKMVDRERVLLVQDTCHLNYDGKKATIGLGHVGSTSDRAFQGIMLHWALALSDVGEPLGVAHAKLWERKPDPRKKRLNAHQNKPIEAKESYKWIEAVNALDGQIPDSTQAIWVSDRESDIYEFIDEIMAKNQDFVIRANNDRVIAEKESLLKERARNAPIIGKERLKFSSKGKCHETEVLIRGCDVELLAQRRKRGATSTNASSDRSINLVHVSSPDLMIEWLLLTSLPIETREECLDAIWIYKQRWHIESVHKALKSGFQVEALTLGEADRLERAIAIMLPCAVRVYWMAHRQKYSPDSPATEILSSTECKILALKNKKPKNYVPTIKEAWLWIGWMGGFRGSKGSKPPGQITFWRGIIKLRDMAAGAEFMAAILET